MKFFFCVLLCSFSASLYSQTLFQDNSAKNYCINRIFINQLAAKNLSGTEINQILNSLKSCSDIYIQREAYRLTALHYLNNTKDSLTAFNYVYLAVSKGADPACFPGEFTNTEKNKIQDLRNRYIASFYLKDEHSFFEKIRKSDQQHRISNDNSLNTKVLMQQSDMMNEKTFSNYIIKHGWPSYVQFDTTDCGFGISSSFSSILSHWSLPYANAIYLSSIKAARSGKLPWFVPISINNLLLSRQPFITGANFPFLSWQFFFTRLYNIDFSIEKTIDLSSDRTILDILAICFRTYKSNDIIILTPSKEFVKHNKMFGKELERFKEALVFMGLEEHQVRIFDYKNNDNLLPSSTTPISYFLIHDGEHQSIMSKNKDSWILDRQFNAEDFNTFFK